METTYNPYITVLLGVFLLFFGRQLFWFFIGIVGFLFGFNLAEQLFPEQSELITFGAGLLLGTIGLFLAIFLERIAVILAGVWAGGLIALNTIPMPESQILMWTIFIIGGLVGGLLMALFFDWALILFSALFGTALITAPFYEGEIIHNIIFILLFALGTTAQWLMLKRKSESYQG